MPITNPFALPSTAQDLPLPAESKGPLFLVFVSSIDPEKGVPWCPDVRAAMPVVEAAFKKPGASPLGVVEVGQRPEWKEPNNVFRTNWKVHGIPCLVRFERRDGQVMEVGRLVEGEILEKEKLDKLLA